MSGTRAGGLKTAAIMKQRYGEDVYRRVGKIGGKISRSGGFASSLVGPDGLTGLERATVAGIKGGTASRRTVSKPKPVEAPPSKYRMFGMFGGKLKAK